MTSTWPLQRIGLKVLDLDLEVDFYRRLGMRALDAGNDHAVFAFGDTPALELRHLRDGRPRPLGAAGLYHFALLLPDEPALGGFLLRAGEQDILIDGASDHLVSAALYLQDPEGNGIEIYADRPADTWTWTGGRVRMATQPLDLKALAAGAGALRELPAESRLGHVHLTTQDLGGTGAFYSGLGMDETAEMRVARFFSWNGYHHHVGVNVFDGPASGPAPDDAAGIDYVEILRPGAQRASLRNPDGVRLELKPAA